MEVSSEDGVAALYLKHDSSAWLSNKTATELLKYLHFAYPLILLVFFITTFTIHSIISANSANDENERTSLSEEHTGPGGKPLPKKTGPIGSNKEVLDFSRPRKLLFEWLALGAALSFVGNAITVVVHALYSRDEQWWCGQATVVSMALSNYRLSSIAKYSLVDLHCRLLYGLRPHSHLHP